MSGGYEYCENCETKTPHYENYPLEPSCEWCYSSEKVTVGDRV